MLGMANKKPGRPTVWICRGGSCGSKKKIPGVPHRRLRDLVTREGKAAGAKIKMVDCQGPCGQGNIVVARSGGVVRWFRKMNDETVTRELLRCVAAPAGAERSLADLPDCLGARVMPKRDGRKPKS